MTHETMITIGLAVLFIAVILYRQLRTRPLQPNYRLPIILGVIGVVLTAIQLRQGATVTAVDMLTFVLGLGLAAALAWPRAKSMKVFRRDGIWMTRGTWLTVLLWLVLMGAHVALVVLLPSLLGQSAHQSSALDQSTTLIFVGASLGLQAYFRARLMSRTDQPSSALVGSAR